MAINVGFLRGSQANLKALNTYKEGSFYLTTYTDRLYFAQSSSELVDLNKYVRMVASEAALPAIATAEVGDFYYISDINVLAVKKAESDTKWTQINPDTTLTANAQNISVEQVTADKEVKVAESVSDSKGHVSKGNFNIVAGNNVHLSVDAATNKITIAADNDTTNTTYSVEASKNGSAAEIHLKGSDSSDDKVGLTLSDGGSLTVANDVIDIAIPSKIKAELSFEADGQLVATATPTSKDGNATSTAVTPKIKLGDNATEYKFASGTATLPVYTKTETDKKITDALAAADALTYKGTVSSTDASSKIVKTANVGEVYKASTNISVTVDGKTIAAKTGDLLISEGKDGAVTWVVVPSGDDQTISGENDTEKVLVKDQSGLIAGIAVADGTHIDVVGTTNGKTTTFTINQKADYTAQDVAGSTADVTLAAATKTPTSAEFTAVTEIETDAYGNVVNGSIKTKKLTVRDTHANISQVATGVEVASTKDKATITTGVTDTDTVSKTDTFALSSTSLEITSVGAESKEAAINLVWGTF